MADAPALFCKTNQVAGVEGFSLFLVLCQSVSEGGFGLVTATSHPVWMIDSSQSGPHFDR